jgi:diguanylate cyclase (GGDEF)-like protein
VAGVLANEAHRPADLAARYGGEEFAVVLPSIDSHGAQIVATRILKGIAQLNIAHAGNDDVGVVTVSVGVVAIVPDGFVAQDELIRTADSALYLAKRAGRNRAVVESAPVTQAS